MDFRERLRSIEESKIEGRWRLFDHLTFRNGLSLSIQAGPLLYSEPAEILTPYEYDSFEVAVLNTEPREIIGDVAEYVPVESVQKMYDQMVDGTFDIAAFQERWNYGS
jgi:hypothetical protein